MSLTKVKDRGGRDYLSAEVCRSCLPAERDSHVIVGVAGIGMVVVVLWKHWFYRR